MAKGIGVFGNGRGKVGNLVLRVNKGQQIISAWQPKVHNPNTPAQQANRKRNAEITAMVSGFKQAYDLGLHGTVQHRTKYSHCHSLNTTAFDNTAFPIIAFIPANVVVSQGNLEELQGLGPVAAASGNVTASFSAGTYGNGLPSDKVVVVVVNTANPAKSFTYTGALRSDAAFSAPIPSTFPTGDAEVYVFASNAANTNASDSAYLGTVTI